MLHSISVILLLCAVAYAAPNNTDNSSCTFVGKLSTLQYEVSGAVYAIDEETLFIKDFNYNGKGPDAFFYIGTEDSSPSEKGKLIKYPQDGTNGDPKVLGAYNKKDITLKLDDGFKISSDLKWFSVWCRQYSVNFGSVTVPSNLEIPDAGETTCQQNLIPKDSASDIVSHSSILLFFTLTLVLSTKLYSI